MCACRISAPVLGLSFAAGAVATLSAGYAKHTVDPAAQGGGRTVNSVNWALSMYTCRYHRGTVCSSREEPMTTSPDRDQPRVVQPSRRGRHDAANAGT